jgi:hypothetical protein
MGTARAGSPDDDVCGRAAGTSASIGVEMVSQAPIEDRQTSWVFETPPSKRPCSDSPSAPPSTHVPSRIGLRTVLHKLVCPSCSEAGSLVLNGTHGTRRSVRCKATKPGGRVCGRSWAGVALSRAVDAAWHEVNTEGRQELMEQEEEVEDHASGSPRGADKLDLEAKVLLVRDGNETRNEVLDAIQIGITEQLALLNENLASSQALMRGAQQLQEETVRLLETERRRVVDLTKALAMTEARCRQLENDKKQPTWEKPPTVERPVSYADIVVQRTQERVSIPVSSQDELREEMRKIGAIEPARATPRWRGITAVYFRNIRRCPIGKLRAIIRTAVHQDAAIAISFLGRNVVEILCTRNRETPLSRFLESMGAQAMPDFRPEAEAIQPKGSEKAHEGNLHACRTRWAREKETCPVRARKWYCDRLDEIGTASPLIGPVHDGLRSDGISTPKEKTLGGADGMRVKYTNGEEGSVTGVVSVDLDSNESTRNHAVEVAVKPTIVGGGDRVVCTDSVMEQVTSVGPFQSDGTTSRWDEMGLGENLEPEVRDDRLTRARGGQNLK